MYTTMHMRLGTHAQILVLFVLAALIVMSLCGTVLNVRMEKDAQTSTSGCMFSAIAICTLSPLAHFAVGQSMFTGTAFDAVRALALLLAAAVFAVYITRRLLFDDVLNFLETRQRLRFEHSLAIVHISSFQEAFSRGILNPKVY